MIKNPRFYVASGASWDTGILDHWILGIYLDYNLAKTAILEEVDQLSRHVRPVNNKNEPMPFDMFFEKHLTQDEWESVDKEQLFTNIYSIYLEEKDNQFTEWYIRYIPLNEELIDNGHPARSAKDDFEDQIPDDEEGMGRQMSFLFCSSCSDEDQNR